MIHIVGTVRECLGPGVLFEKSLTWHTTQRQWRHQNREKCKNTKAHRQHETQRSVRGRVRQQDDHKWWARMGHTPKNGHRPYCSCQNAPSEITGHPTPNIGMENHPFSLLNQTIHWIICVIDVNTVVQTSWNFYRARQSLKVRNTVHDPPS